MTEKNSTTEKNLIFTQLAEKFSEVIAKCLGHANMLEAIRLNATPEYRESGCCATHDFYDANMAMCEAFFLLNNRYLDLQSDGDTECWNRAWELAKKNNFWFVSPTVNADKF